uniref:Glycosyltransferase n=1 Tax=candidate division CPR3 bacterium TaxID=2268181 RepID=A0A7V3JAE4_UNCC3
MRIAQIAYSFIEDDTRVLRYITALTRSGHEVDVFALKRSGQPLKGNVYGATVFRIQKREVNEAFPLSYFLKLLNFFFLSAAWLSIRHSVRPYQLIHVHNVPDFLVFATLFPRITGAKIILDIHDILPELYAHKFNSSKSSLVFKALLQVEKLSAKFADYVIAANDIWLQRLTQRSVRPEKCLAMINYPDTLLFKPAQNGSRRGSDGRFILLYPGTLNRHQGLDVAVRAMALIREKIPVAELQIYGEGPSLQYLKKMVREMDLEGKVFFHSTVPLEELVKIIHKASVGIIPKLADGFGNEAFSTKSMEFMACGVPVIMSRTLIDTTYFTDDHVWFFNPGDPASLADTIYKVYSRPEETRTKVKASLELVSRNNWEVKKNEYVSLVERLVQKQCSG